MDASAEDEIIRVKSATSTKSRAKSGGRAQTLTIPKKEVSDEHELQYEEMMQELIALKNELLRIKQHYKPLEAICDLTLNKYDPSKGKY